jgi:GNAT superfamily N-acetyltransferase
MPLDVRRMTLADLPAADALRALAGWNQTLTDWQRFLALEPGGCFVAEWDGRVIGTATTLCYGLELGWIGMMLVHPEHRRHGAGGALLERCIACLRARGVGSIKLDATPLGKKLYDRFGFVDEWTLTRWTRAATVRPPSASVPNPCLRPWREADHAFVDRLSADSFGVPRGPLLLALARESGRAVVSESAWGTVTGYGQLRDGSRAMYLGPVMAETPSDALLIVEALLADTRGHGVYWDIPDANTPVADWARGAGFTPERPLIRMFLGRNTALSDPLRQFALAGPELG